MFIYTKTKFMISAWVDVAMHYPMCLTLINFLCVGVSIYG